MNAPKRKAEMLCLTVLLVMAGITAAYGQSTGFTENIFPVGKLKPTDSVLKVKVGDLAPDFTLPAVDGGKISLGQYKGRKNVVISFVPAAWTPVCSDRGRNSTTPWMRKTSTSRSPAPGSSR